MQEIRLSQKLEKVKNPKKKKQDIQKVGNKKKQEI